MPVAESNGARILEMIRPQGAALTGTMKDTDWHDHSVRGFLSTAPKNHALKTEFHEDRGRRSGLRDQQVSFHRWLGCRAGRRAENAAICGNIGSYLQWARPIPLKLVLAVVAGQSRSNSANDLTPACKHSASMALRRASLAKSCSRLNSLPRP